MHADLNHDLVALAATDCAALSFIAVADERNWIAGCSFLVISRARWFYAVASKYHLQQRCTLAGNYV
jgi:hypothetical protein